MDQEPVKEPTESLDSNTEDLETSSTQPGDGFYPNGTSVNDFHPSTKPSFKNIFSDISPRTVVIVSAVITLVVLLITSLAVLLFTKDQGEDVSSLVPTQDIDLSGSDDIDSDIFTGKEKALFVNGDIIADGSLSVSDNGQVVVIQPAALSEDRIITLPDNSGTVCLDSNNCNFATTSQLQQLQSQLGQIIIPGTSNSAFSLVNNQQGAVSIQGTTNRVLVSTNNGVIRLSTPQDLAIVSSPTFSNLTLSGNLNVGGNLTLPLNCTTFLNGGSLTTNSNGRIICADDETSGGGTSVTTSGGTPGSIPVFTAVDEIEDSIISQALGTITVAGSLSVSTNVTFSSLANGFLSVNGSGLVSVNTIDLGIDTNGNYVLGLTAGNGINVGGAPGEGWSPTVSIAVQANKGLEVDGSGLSLIDCSNGQVLKYNGSNQWVCGTDTDTTGSFSIDADSGVPETVNNGDTINFSGGNNITTSVDPTDTITIDTVNNPNFTVSVTTPLLQSSGALSITPGGALAVGSTGQTALLQGSTTTITSNGAGNDIILTSSDQIRLTGFNCSTFDNGGVLTTDASGNISCQNDDGDPPNGVTGSGTANRLAIFTGPQAIGDSWILQNGSTLELDASRDFSLLGGNFSVTGTGLFTGLVTANGGLTVEAGDTFTFNGDAFTDLTGTGLVISTGSLQTTLGTSVDLGAEVNGTLPVASGGTGLGSTPTNGQLLIGNGSGYTLATLTQGAGMTITNGVGSITVASAFGASVDLGIDTTGDYVEDITAGNGLTGSASGPGSNPTLALGPLTADWNQTGAFDVVLNNASSELRILESVGATFYGTLDVGDLTANRTYTLPDDDGEVCLVEAGNCAGSGSGVTTSGGTTNRLTKFTAGQNIEDAAISEDGSNVTILGSVDLIVQGGDATLGTAVQDGSLTIYNNGFGALIQASLTGPQTYTLPDGSGEFCIKELGNCSGGSGGNAPVDAQYITLALNGTLTAERVLVFDGTNFSVTDGGANGNYSVNTAQNIDTSAMPTFAGLTLNGTLSVASNTISGTTAVIDFTNFDVAANGNTIVAGTLDVSGLTNLTGGLTVQTGDTFTFNGDAFTDLTGTGLTISTGSLQTTLGTSVDLAAEVNGILPILNGGTGANSQQNAINNLSGLTTEGDLLYFDGADTTRLARGSNGECLISNATTLVWSSCTAGSITGLTLAGTSGTPQAIGNGDTITIAAGSNITTTGVATDTVTVAVVSNPTFSGTVTAAAFSGDGSALTDLDADELTSGIVDPARISGDYTGITGVGTLNAGSIGPSFGAIDTGSDNITTTGTISGGNITVSGSQFTNNGSTLNTAQSLGDFPAGGSIGSAATTVDVDTSFGIAQTTAGQTLSLPSPTSATAGRVVFVLNTGSSSFTMHGITIPAGYGQIYIWNGSSWILGASGGGSAVTLQASYDGGNTILTTNARDIDITLANSVTTDANFTIDIATGSTGEFQIEANGTDILQIGSAGQLQLDVQGVTGGILLGTDANLYRSAADTLKTDDNLIVQPAGGSSVAFQVLDSSGGGVMTVNSSGSAAEIILGGVNKTDSTIRFQRSGSTRYSIGSDSSALGGPNSFFIYNHTDSEYVAAFRTDGSAWFSNSTDSANGFQIQNDAGTSLFNVNTAGNDIEFNSAIELIWGGDTNLYRGGSDLLQTDSEFHINDNSLTIERANDFNGAIHLNVTGDSDNRFTLQADGTIEWGDGTNPLDTNLYRNGDGVLATDGWFELLGGGSVLLEGGYLQQVDAASGTDIFIDSAVLGDSVSRFRINSDGGLSWGDGTSSRDTNLYRTDPGELTTDGGLVVNNGDDAGLIALRVLGTDATIDVGGGTNLSYIDTPGNWSDQSTAGDSVLRASDGDLILAARSASGNILFTTGAADTTKATLTNTGNFTLVGDMSIQGGDLTTNQTTFNLLNSTATTINFGGGATTALNIGPGGATGTSINLAGGSGATGCTVDGAAGNLTCSGNITSTATSGTQGWWSRAGTTLSPANAGDNVLTSGNLQLTSDSGTNTSGIRFGSAGDANLYRESSDVLKTTSSFAIQDSETTAFQVQNASGTPILNIDTLNALLELDDDGGVSGESYATFNNRAVFGYDGATQDAVIRGTSDKGVRIYTDDTVNALTFNADGHATFQNGTDDADAFRIQDSNGDPLFRADTLNKKLEVIGDVNVGNRYGNRLFSDNFESGGFGLWNDGTDGDISASTSIVYNGRYSAELDPATTDAAAETFISPSSTAYMRAWVYMDDQTSSNADLLNLSDADWSNSWTVYRNGTTIQLWNDPDGFVGSAGGFTLDEWHLIEMRVTIGAGTGTSQVWLDGSLVINASGSENNGTDLIEIAAIGDWGGREFTAYIDDVVVDTVSTGTPSSLIVDDTFHVGGNASFGNDLYVENSATLDGQLAVLGGRIYIQGGDEHIISVQEEAWYIAFTTRYNNGADVGLQINADGQLNWANDTNLYRYSADFLVTDDDFGVGDDLMVTDQLRFGPSEEWALYQDTGTDEFKLYSANNADDVAIWAPNGQLTLNTTTDESMIIDSWDGDDVTFVQYRAQGTDYFETGVQGGNQFFIYSDVGGTDVFIIDSTGDTDIDGELTLDFDGGTSSTNGVCHSGADIDGTSSGTNRKLLPCNNSAGDIAEWYEAKEDTQPGDIVTLSDDLFTYQSTIVDPYTGIVQEQKETRQISKIEKSAIPYQQKVLGIISTNPAQVYGADIKEQGSNPVPVALSGRVPVNISPDSDSIQPGDYVTTSGYSGKAMKATQAGFVIGKALEAWDPASGSTQVMVFVEQGYWPGPTQQQYLQNGDDANLTNLTVSGTANLASLNVSGATTINDLTVIGSATITDLTVTGNASFDGPTISFSNNVRGVNQPIEEGSNEEIINFDTPHPDADYAVQCTPSYNTTCYVTDKTVDSFKIHFGTSAPDEDQKVDWFVIR